MRLEELALLQAGRITHCPTCGKEIKAGGAGSGCNPAVGVCGRPPGAGVNDKGINWKRGRDAEGVQNRFSVHLDGKHVVITREPSPTRAGKFRWKMTVDGQPVGKGFYKNAQAAREAFEANKDKFLGKQFVNQMQQPAQAPAPAAAPRPSANENTDPAYNTRSDDTPFAKMAVVERKALGGGINQTYVITLENGQKAVWKPVSGENSQLTGDIGGPMYTREAAAYDVAKLVGAPVPETAVREVTHGGGRVKVGSAQAFVPGVVAGNAHVIGFNKFLPWTSFDQDNMRSAAAFDFVVRNTDRHQGNYMVEKDNGKFKVHQIDNGLAFSKWGGHSSQILNIVAANEGSIPMSVKEQWRDKLPQIEQAMRSRSIKEKDIQMVKDRYNVFMTTSTWRDLQNQNDRAGLPEKKRGLRRW